MFARYLVRSRNVDGELLFEEFADYAQAEAFCRDAAEEDMSSAIFQHVRDFPAQDPVSPVGPYAYPPICRFTAGQRLL